MLKTFLKIVTFEFHRHCSRTFSMNLDINKKETFPQSLNTVAIRVRGILLLTDRQQDTQSNTIDTSLRREGRVQNPLLQHYK